ncbi:hypothetical protein Hanom_Chr15g01344271 [Helianthus anomalus]
MCLGSKMVHYYASDDHNPLKPTEPPYQRKSSGLAGFRSKRLGSWFGFAGSELGTGHITFIIYLYIFLFFEMRVMYTYYNYKKTSLTITLHSFIETNDFELF